MTGYDLVISFQFGSDYDWVQNSKTSNAFTESFHLLIIFHLKRMILKAFQSLGADLNHFFFKILFFLLALHILTPFPFRILAERLSQSHIRLR